MSAELKQFLQAYWPHVVLLVSLVASISAAVHAAMTKRDVRAAIGWVAVVIFSPLLGATFYLFAGINRVRRERVSHQRKLARQHRKTFERLVLHNLPASFEPQLKSLHQLGNAINRYDVLKGNSVSLLSGGDQTYAAMLSAIEQATLSVALQSYIFDNDHIGRRIAQALIDAHQRGVQVRVLIDAVGAKYSHPAIIGVFEQAGVPVARFLPTAIGMRLVYANMRSHRKLLVVDGRHALAGGMNIREGFTSEFAGDDVASDTHFEVTGPVVLQLLESFAHDWEFTTGEHLDGKDWYGKFDPVVEAENVPIRVVLSGPDDTLGHNQGMLLGALSVAQHHVRIQSPYFLPDTVLIGAIITAARRGVKVDVVIPENNNLKLVGAAMEAQLDQLLECGVRVWRAKGTFDHSKLMTIDGQWAYVGSSNVDPRSQRLNFELDLEVYDTKLTQQIDHRIDQRIANSQRATLNELASRSFWTRLRHRFIWLASPYL